MKYIYALVTLILFTITDSYAQWDGNPATVDNPVSTSPTLDYTISSVTDGAGGAIVVWSSSDQTNTTYSIYAQRKSSGGQVMWNNASTPKLIYSTTKYLLVNDVIADGAGGVYICWQADLDETSLTADVYLQHLNGSGNNLFVANGIKVNPVNGHYNSSANLTADATGVIIAWTAETDDQITELPTYAQVFAQRYNSTGTAQWTAGGVQVCTAGGFRAIPVLISDGSSGAIIAFSDSRNSLIDPDNNFTNIDIFSQRLSSTGSRLWGNDALILNNEPYHQFVMSNRQHATRSAISDGAGGMILVYEDYKNNNDGNPNYYAQRINNAGTRLWNTAGISLATASVAPKSFANCVSDGANGAVVVWDETSVSFLDSAIVAQRIVAAGTTAWGVKGKQVNGNEPPGFGVSTIDADGTGNYVFSWGYINLMNGTAKIKGQKLNNNGALQWAANGVDICTNPVSFPANPYIVKSDGTNMIVAWEDARNPLSNNDIYAAKIATTGILVGGTTATAYITTANGNWNTPATWVGNAVPPAGVDVIVRHTVSGNLTTTCNSLKVESPGNLTVNTGITITILH